MSRLDRYIIREIGLPFLVALLILTFMLVARELGVLLELLVRRSATPEEVRALVAAIVPGALTFTIPLALLAGVLSGFGRLSSEGETVALRATGISTAQILRPVLAVAVMAWLANLGLALWVAPRTAARLAELTSTITLMRQLPLELEPRVFNEDLDGWVLYVRDISVDGRDWTGVFLADVRDPGQLHVISAESGRLTSLEDELRYEITLRDGSDEIVPRAGPDRYISQTFDRTTIPLPVPPRAGAARSGGTPQQISTGGLLDSIRAGDASIAERLEFHRRLALPFACIAFTLVGLPLGMSTRRGGRSIGLVFSALLMLAYYTIFIGGTGTASSESAISPLIGTWLANAVFLLLGIVLLARAARPARDRVRRSLPDAGGWLRQRISGLRSHLPRRRVGARLRTKWFRTLDLYLIRGFLFFFLLVIASFVTLVIVVTLFELLPDVVEHEAGVSLIVAYFFYYTPQILYLVVPLAVLVAVFITVGSLTRSNETLAVRAGAISLYRMVLPLIATSLLLSAGLYLMGEVLLPYTNQKQDAYRDTIKGRASQTYLDPLRKWMVGSGGQIYYYNYFDPEQNTFADLSVFEFDPATWQLTRWTFAPRARRASNRWILENGWTRGVPGQELSSYAPFGELELDRTMDDPDYFKREVRIASQMSYSELNRHIEDLNRAGFEVGRLRVDLYSKVSFPLVALIMAMIGIPFALSTGRRSAFFGIGIAILIGIGYWAAFELFGKLGGMSQLSPAIAAWFPNLIFGFSGIWMLLKVRT